jgi:hypothetical protein
MLDMQDAASQCQTACNRRLMLQDREAQQALVASLHKLKTDLFMQLVETGAMPLRPGVKRLVDEAMASGNPAG